MCLILFGQKHLIDLASGLRETANIKLLLTIKAGEFSYCRGSLSTRVLRRGRQPEGNISRARAVVSLRFLYQ